eukprot:15243839-Alexandrium_andersonii.AAC.1
MHCRRLRCWLKDKEVQRLHTRTFSVSRAAQPGVCASVHLHFCAPLGVCAGASVHLRACMRADACS